MTDETPSLFNLTDRRSLFRAESEIALFDDRIEARRGGALVRRIGFDQIKRVRLTVEPAGQSTQIVCSVEGASGRIAFSSKRLTATKSYDDQVMAFKPMLVALHECLAEAEGGIEFLEGPSLALLLGLSGLGAVMALSGLAFSAYMFAVQESAMLGFASLPFMLIGGALAWVFKPAKPKPYDRAGLIERFKD